MATAKIWCAACAPRPRRINTAAANRTPSNEMSAETIYNFEVLVPEACKTVLVAAGLTAITLADAQALQKTRPRVEIVYKHLGETTPKRLAILPDGSKRTSCFRGEL